jgi:mannosyl-oligosaccharide alpha-1,2-mannosidase
MNADCQVSEIIRSQAIYDGIAPIFIAYVVLSRAGYELKTRPQNGQFVMSEIRLGSRGDSYYEYLIK